MKYIIFITVAVLMAISSVCANVNTKITENNKLSATYIGQNEYDEYVFEDSSGKKHVFALIDEEIDIDLYDEENNGKQFEITWEEIEQEIEDESGEEVTVKKVKRIIGLKEI